MPKKNIIIVIIALVVIIGGIIYYSQNEQIQESNKPELGSRGIIEGSLAYPSEQIPSDMRVCAENIESGKKYCSDEQITDSKYKYERGYKVLVPAGEYYVFSSINNIDYYAYYSDFVVCGLTTNCSSHRPIKISIKQNQILDNIDPIDWYISWDEAADFIETGNLVNGQGAKWALLYEKPGKPALKMNLSFTDKSLCDLGQETKNCLILPDDYWKAGDRVKIEGNIKENNVVVYNLIVEGSKDNLIKIFKPLPNEVIEGPLKIRGEARGNWFFEATFPVVLADWDGRIIKETYAQTKENWMTENFVNFSLNLEFEKPFKKNDPDFMKRGSLILQKANPSGLPENDNALEITVFFD